MSSSLRPSAKPIQKVEDMDNDGGKSQDDMNISLDESSPTGRPMPASQRSQRGGGGASAAASHDERMSGNREGDGLDSLGSSQRGTMGNENWQKKFNVTKKTLEKDRKISRIQAKSEQHFTGH